MFSRLKFTKKTIRYSSNLVIKKFNLRNFKKVGQLAEIISHKGKFEDSDRLNLWKVDVDKSKIGSIEDDIRELKGVPMEPEYDFKKHFEADYEPTENTIHIVAVFAATTTELGRKRPIMEEETTELKRKNWDTNSAIRKAQRAYVYFVDPLALSRPLLNKIRDSEFMALHGARASTRETDVPLLTDSSVKYIIEIFKKHGSDGWWKLDDQELLAPEYKNNGRLLQICN